MKTYWIDYSFITYNGYELTVLKDWLVSHGMYFSNSIGLYLIKLEDVDVNYFKLKHGSYCHLYEFKNDK